MNSTLHNSQPNNSQDSEALAQQEQAERQLLRQARRRVDLKMGWLTHACVFVLVNLGFALLGDGQRWTQFPLWGWGLGLAIHGVVTLLALNGGGLRERMLAKELEQLKRHKAQP
ncbi:MAG: 2TM domain-containing protein [Roseateles asaccharophilus]|uniref:2TM domain-containing protein n=1 Tax=Roseateles asaccharophilus TaxID=582607 RepID=A0A4V3CK99_9BURK|nr:2TM domain-containing protein [Roseateles asaccharophilus]MDN3543164.1 2TM domain-containing protein [Roseateles asaccharophilus]TDP13137.1 2TM domain-containing protein [Roseateles asaccharophilus]